MTRVDDEKTERNGASTPTRAETAGWGKSRSEKPPWREEASKKVPVSK